VLAEAGFIEPTGPNIAKLMQLGPTLAVVVSTSSSDGAEPQRGRAEQVPALVDTGASSSMIDNALATRLGLIQIDTAKIAGVHGVNDHPVYLAQISVPVLGLHQFDKFVGANLREGGQIQEAILGRDFLFNVIMIYDGIRGQVSIASNLQIPPN